MRSFLKKINKRKSTFRAENIFFPKMTQKCLGVVRGYPRPSRTNSLPIFAKNRLTHIIMKFPIKSPVSDLFDLEGCGMHRVDKMPREPKHTKKPNNAYHFDHLQGRCEASVRSKEVTQP